MHLRPPSIDHGIVSFLWAIGFGVFVWAGLRAIAVASVTSFVIAVVAAFAIFLFVRVYGDEEPRRP